MVTTKFTFFGVELEFTFFTWYLVVASVHILQCSDFSLNENESGSVQRPAPGSSYVILGNATTDECA